MEQLTFNNNLRTDNLFANICSPDQLTLAWKLVRSNKGAAGVDKVTIGDFDKSATQQIAELSEELKNWTYKPNPVRRVEIPKPGSTGKRELGIPTVRDRIVQQSVKMSLEPLYETKFSDSSFGFRPNKGQHDAIEQSREYLEEGKDWVVDIDLEKFFDRVNHDRLLYLLRQDVEDRRAIKLIAMILKSGIEVDGKRIRTELGTPQGSPLSPLLSNIVLDELDKELEKRGLSFCRYADDCQIYVGSRKAGERVMKSLINYIENRLKLVVNSAKSQVRKVTQSSFLGFVVTTDGFKLSSKAKERAKAKIRNLTPRRSHIPLEVQLEGINKWLRGWSNYYLPALNWRKLTQLEGHIRRRLRSQLISNQKRRRHLKYKLQRQGVRSATVPS